MSSSSEDRLRRQLAFLLEIDRVKDVERRSFVTGTPRRERTGEHQWHVAVFAVVLAEHADPPVDVSRVVTMLLLHDIVEIDAGDTYLYDVEGQATKRAREEQAADRIYALLPEGQASELRSMWEEYEAGQTPEARFAHAIDRLQPILLNYTTGGEAWREGGVTSERVLAANRHIADGAPALWERAQALIADAAERGLFDPGDLRR